MGACNVTNRGLSSTVTAFHMNRTPFYGIPKASLAHFAKTFRFCKFENGETIFEVGTPNKLFYVLFDGEVLIKDGDEVVTKKYNGDVLNNNFIEEITCKYNAIASRRSSCLFCSRVDLLIHLNSRWGPLIRDYIKHTKERIIRSAKILQGVSDELVHELAAISRYISLNTNEVLFHEGSHSTAFYFVALGKLEAVTFGDYDEEIVLKKIVPGECFGEYASIVNMPRTATIIATERSLLLEISCVEFDKFMHEVPKDVISRFKEAVNKRAAECFRSYDVPFFQAIPDEDYEFLASLVKIEQIPAKSVICKQGDFGDKFYIIAYGKARVEINDDDQSFEISQMGPGDYFGEIALVRNMARTATVTAIDRCVVFSLARSDFMEFCKQFPSALVEFQVKLARYDIHLMDLIKHSVGFQYFMKYLELNNDEMTLNFWVSAYDFEVKEELHDKNTNSGQKTVIYETARKIMGDYLMSDSPKNAVKKPGKKGAVSQPVHLKDVTIAKVKKAVEMEQIDRNTFREAKEEALIYLDEHYFRDFKQSKMFQEFLYESSAYSRRRLSVPFGRDVIPDLKEDKQKTAVPKPRRRAVFFSF